MILLDCFPYVMSISLILFVYICICIYFPSTSMFILQTYRLCNKVDTMFTGIPTEEQAVNWRYRISVPLSILI